MRIEILHPSDPAVLITYGWDHALPGGFFAAVDFSQSPTPQTKNRAVIEYDAFQSGFSHDYPLRGCLEFLAEHGVFTLDDLNEAIVWFDVHGNTPAPKRLRVALAVLSDLKSAAD